MTLEEIRSITEYFKSVGVTQFEANGLKVVFDPRAFSIKPLASTPEDKAKMLIEEFNNAQTKLSNSDDKDLFWSVD